MLDSVFTKLKMPGSVRTTGVARFLYQIWAILRSPEIRVFHRSATGLNQAPSECSPCIQVEIVDGRRNLGTPLTLFNRGRGRAYDVQIQPIRLEQGTVTFRKIRAVSSGEAREVLPNLDTRAILHKHDLTKLLMVEWKSLKDSTINEFPVRARVTYRDSRRNWFETCFEVTFYPFEDTAPTEWGGRRKMVDATAYEYHRLGKIESLVRLGALTSSGLHHVPDGSPVPSAN